MPTSSPSPFAAGAAPLGKSALPGGRAPTPPPTPESASADASGPTEGDASAVLAEVVAIPSSEAQEKHVADAWAGRVIEGEGKVSFTSTIFGKDSELGVSGGSKVTVEVPVAGAGVIAPKVVLHLPEAPPAGALGFGKVVRFQGEVKGYRGLGRNLLLLHGRIL